MRSCRPAPVSAWCPAPGSASSPGVGPGPAPPPPCPGAEWRHQAEAWHRAPGRVTCHSHAHQPRQHCRLRPSRGHVTRDQGCVCRGPRSHAPCQEVSRGHPSQHLRPCSCQLTQTLPARHSCTTARIDLGKGPLCACQRTEGLSHFGQMQICRGAISHRDQT